MSSSGSDTPFMFLEKLKVKKDKVSEYLEIADKTDKVIKAINGTGVQYKIFKTKLGYSRV